MTEKKLYTCDICKTDYEVYRKLYPLTITRDRYSGVYSGGDFTAWNLDPDEVPWEITASDETAMGIFDKIRSGELNLVYGIGRTPNEAATDLYLKVNKVGYKNMKKNCIDSPCKFCSYVFVKSYTPQYCLLRKELVPDNIEGTYCQNFELAQTCIDCKHAIPQVYENETGTIDDIKYRCPFQNNKLIYDDSSVAVSHYNDIPECNIGKFELDGSVYEL